MSGVIVDVNTRAEGSKKDLADVNNALLRILRNSKPARDGIVSSIKEQARASESLGTTTKRSYETIRAESKKTNDVITKGTGDAASAVGSLKTAILSLGGAYLTLSTANFFNNSADEVLRLRNRLSLVVTEQSAVIGKQYEMLAISQKTRSSISDTVSLYAEFRKSLENTNISDARITRIVETIQKAGKLSGSSNESIKAAITQLNQGIGSGFLRGEELNSVNEQLKYLGQGISKFVGLRGKALLDFAEGAQLTNTVIVDALESMANQTDKDFGRVEIAVSDATTLVRDSLRSLVGDINLFSGSAQRLSKFLVGVSTGLNDINSVIIAASVAAKNGIKNYIAQFDLFDAAQLTLRGLASGAFDVSDLYTMYSRYSELDNRIEKIREKLAKRVTIKPAINTDGIENTDANIKKPEFDLTTYKALLAELFETFRVTFVNIGKLFPVIAGPVVELVGKVTNGIRNLFVNLETSVYRSTIPAIRQLQGVGEFLTGYLINDTALERSWVRLFRSDSVKSFTKNLRDLNAVRNTIKFDNERFAAAAGFAEIRAALKPVEDVLIFLNLMDNRILQARSPALDYLVQYTQNIGRVIRRLYDDIFGPVIEPFLRVQLNAIRAFLSAVRDAYQDLFIPSDAFGLGRRIGKALQSVIATAIRSLAPTNLDLSFSEFIVVALKGLVNVVTTILQKLIQVVIGFVSAIAYVFNLDYYFKSMSSKVEKAFDTIREKFSDMLDWLQTAGKRLGNSLSGISFTGLFEDGISYIEKMFSRVARTADRFLSKTKSIVADFGKYVKDVFYDVYDKVVGNSYWPDTVDEVVSYSKFLEKALVNVGKFGESVKALFSKIYDSISESSSPMMNALRDFSQAFSELNFTDVAKRFSTQLGAALIAALLLTFGDIRTKLISANFLFGAINTSLGGIFSTLLPPISKFLGEASGQFAEAVIEGAIQGFDRLVGALPSILGGFLKGLLPFGDALASIFDSIPYIPILSDLLNNNLLYAIGAAMTAYALLAKNGTSQVKQLLFGGAKDSKNKKASDFEKEGVFGYLLGGSPAAGGFSQAIDNLFGGKKMALAIAAAFSAALLDSVSIFESLAVGVPLIAYAIMGKAGGARAVKESMSVIEQIVLSSYSAILNKSESLLGKESFVTKFIGGPKSIYDALTKTRSKSALSKSFDGILSDVKQGFQNLRKNGEAYGKGQMSLTEAFLTEKVLFRTDKDGKRSQYIKKTQLKKSFESVLSELGSIQIGGSTVKSVTEKVASLFNKVSSQVQNVVKNTNLATSITGLAADIGTGLKGYFSKSFSEIGAGVTALFSGLGGLLRSQVAKIALVLGSIFGASGAFAATFSDTASEFSTAASLLGIGVTALVGSLLALRSVGRVSNTIVTGKKALLEEVTAPFQSQKAATLANVGTLFLEGRAARKAKFDSDSKKQFDSLEKERAQSMMRAAKNPSSQAGIQTAFEIQRAVLAAKLAKEFEKSEKAARATAETAALASINAKERDAIAKVKASEGFKGIAKNAIGAELRGLTASLTGVFASISLAVPAAIAGAGKLFSILSGTTKTVGENVSSMGRLASALNGVGASIELIRLGEFKKGLGGLATSISTSFAGSFGVIKDAFSGISKAGKGASGILSGIFTGLTTAGKGLAGILGSALTALWPLIKVPLLLTGGGLVAGVMGLHFFGPGNNFIENLEWAYDKAREFLGLERATGGGRKVEIQSLTASRQIGENSFNLTNDVSKINFEKLTSVQYAALLEVSKQVNEGFNNLAIKYEQQGSLTAEQTAEFKKLSEDLKSVVIRQPRSEKSTIQENFDNYSDEINKVDNSLWSMIKRMVGWQPILSDTANGLSSFTMKLQYWSEALVFNFSTGIIVAITTGIGLLGGPAGAIAGAKLGLVLSVIFNGAIEGLSSLFSGIDSKLGISSGISKISSGISTGFTIIGKELSEWATTAALSFYTDFQNAFGGTQDKERTDRFKTITKESEDLRKYFTQLSNQDQDSVKAAFEEYAAADRVLAKLRTEGFTFKNAKSIEDFNKKLAEAEARAKSAYDSLRLVVNVFGEEGKQLSNIKAYNQELKQLSSQLKVSTGIDLGEQLQGFYGNSADLDKLREFVTAGDAIKSRLNRTFTSEGRLEEQLNLDNLTAKVRAFTDKLKESGTLEGQIGQVAKTTGLTELEIRRVKLTDESKFIILRSLSAELDELKQKAAAAKAGDNVNVYSDTLAQIAKVEQKIAGQLTFGSLEDLNAVLQTINVSAISAEQFIRQSEGQSSQLAASLARLRAEQRVLNDLKISSPFSSEYIEQLKTVLGLMAQLNQQAAINKASAVQSVLNTSQDDTSAALNIGAITGRKPSNVVLGSAGKTSRFNQLLLQQTSLEAQRASFETTAANGGAIDTKAFQSVARQLQSVEKSITDLDDVTVTTLSSVLSAISASGIEISRETFAKFSASARNALLRMGLEIEANNQRLEKLSAGGAAAILPGVIKAAEASFSKIREIAAKELFTSGGGSFILDKLGASADDVIEGTKENINIITSLFAKTLQLESQLSNAGTAEAFLQARQNLSLLRDDVSEFLQSINKSVGPKLSKIGEVFGISGENSSILSLLGTSLNSTAAEAVKFSNDLTQAMKTGVTRSGESLADTFVRELNFKRRGAVLQIGIDLAEAFVDTLTLGKTLETLQGIIPSGLPKSKQIQFESLAPNAKALSQLEKIASGPLNAQLAQALEEFNGGNAEDIVAKVKAIAAKGGAADGSTVSADFLKTFEKAVSSGKVGAFDKALESLGLFDTISSFGKDLGLEGAAVLKANDRQRSLAGFMIRRILELETELTTATTSNAPVIQAAIASTKEELQKLSSGIIDSSLLIKNAGIEFLGSIREGFRTSLSDFLKGRAEEGKSAFRTLLDSILNTFTNAVLDTFTKGITNSLFSEKSPLGEMLTSLGGDIFDLGDTWGKSANKALYVQIVSGGIAGKISSALPTQLPALLNGLESGFKGSVMNPILKIFGLVSGFFSGGNLTEFNPGGVLAFADGGKISGPGSTRSDSIPFMGSNGEFIVNAAATSRHLPLLEAINNNRSLARFADGGVVSPRPNFAAVTGTAKTTTVNHTTNLRIVGDVSRQTRREVMGMIPELASGISSYTLEKG